MVLGKKKFLRYTGQNYNLVICKGGNISREKFTNKLHDFWKFGLFTLMSTS